MWCIRTPERYQSWIYRRNTEFIGLLLTKSEYNIKTKWIQWSWTLTKIGVVRSLLLHISLSTLSNNPQKWVIHKGKRPCLGLLRRMVGQLAIIMSTLYPDFKSHSKIIVSRNLSCMDSLLTFVFTTDRSNEVKVYFLWLPN